MDNLPVLLRHIGRVIGSINVLTSPQVLIPISQIINYKCRVSSHFWQKLYRNIMYNLPKIHGFRLPCSNASPPFNWQMKKNSRKNAGFLIMVFISKDRKLILQSQWKTRCVGTTRMSLPWILRRLANVSPFFNSLSNRVRITNEFQSWSVTYDYTLSYQKSSQYLKS